MLEVEHLTKQYDAPGGALTVLRGVNLTLDQGDAACVTGPSGSGKSTLLYILGALEPPGEGEVRLSGQNPFSLSEEELAVFRNEKVGFVFQDHCLLPQCTVLENVLTPTLVAEDGKDHESKARQLLEQVGLGARLDHRPAELSGGEKQRVAVARALIRDPELLLCDEPTGNLDEQTADEVATVLLDLHRARQGVLVAVTHSQQLAARFPIRFELSGHNLNRLA